MEDIKALKKAKYYMAAMADGINPLTGEYAEKDDTISQEKVQECCAYISELLNKIIENGGLVQKKRLPFSITPEQKNTVEISSEPIEIAKVAKRINAATEKNIRNISGAKIAAWLVKKGYLTLEVSKENVTKEIVKTKKVLNEHSGGLGITSVCKVNNSDGEVYEKPLYNETAQKFILDNIDSISKDE